MITLVVAYLAMVASLLLAIEGCARASGVRTLIGLACLLVAISVAVGLIR